MYKLNFVSGALESSTRQRLPIIQNLMQTVSTLSKSIYPRPKSGSGLQSDTPHPLARDLRFNSAFSPFPFSLPFPFLSRIP